MPLNVNETIASMDLGEENRDIEQQTYEKARDSAQPQEEKEQNGITVYVGDIPPTMDEQRLLNLTSSMSMPPIAIRICRDLNTGESYGYGFLKYNTLDDANGVIAALNCTEIDNYTIRLELFDKEQKKDREGNVYVKDLTPSVTARTLYEFLAPLGPIESIKIPTVMQKNGKSMRLNYGFIQFETKEKAERAIRLLNTTSIKGSYLKASKFQPLKERRQNKDSTLDCVIKYIPAEMPEEILLRELNLQLVAAEENDGTLINELTEKNVAIITKFSKTTKKKNSGYVFAFVTFYNEDMMQKTEQKLESLNSKFKLSVDIKGFDEKHPKTILTMEKVLTKAELINSKRERSLKKESQMRKKNVYIRGIPKTYKFDDFTKLCETFGGIESIWLAELDGEDDDVRNKGYGYCCYKDATVAEKAIECLNGHFIENRSLYASIATTLRERSMQMAGGRYMFPQQMHVGGHPMPYGGGYMGGSYGEGGYYGGKRGNDMGRGNFHNGGRGGEYAHGRQRYGGKRREFMMKEQSEKIENAVMDTARVKPSVARMVTQSLMKVYGEKELEVKTKNEEEFKKLVQAVLANIDGDNLAKKDGRN
eukprot:GAHX01000122.1.p1 GENE.GAHX01000122.1~~GAHX01000122.1.p1  ORF type:complete len:592 (+),score=139.78 GAHX01000122.1:62-1837(+)